MVRKLILIFAIVTSVACATLSGGGARHSATQGVVVAHTTLAALQDGEMALVCGKPTAPDVPYCISGDLHRKISGYLAEAFEYDIQVAAIIRDIPEGNPTPIQALTLMGKIGNLITTIMADIPRSPQQAELAAKLGQ
jgi:hypothetical protein